MTCDGLDLNDLIAFDQPWVSVHIHQKAMSPFPSGH